jgi:hypothetical protein
MTLHSQRCFRQMSPHFFLRLMFISSNCNFLFHLDRHCCSRRRQAWDLLIFNKDVTLGNLDFITIWDAIWRERQTDRERKSVVLSRSTTLIVVHAVGEKEGRGCFYSCCNNFHHSLISGWWCIHILPLCLSSPLFVMKTCGQTKVARCIPTGCQKQVNNCTVHSLRPLEMHF